MTAPRRLAVLCLFVVSVGSAQAEAPVAIAPGSAPTSLLFSPEALALIEAATRRRPGSAPDQSSRPLKRPALAPAAIHLSAIVYHGPDDWRVWLNGRSFAPGARPGPVEILAVDPDGVILAVHDRSGPSRRVRLRPNQSYLPARDAVVEGRPVPPGPPSAAKRDRP